MKTAALFLHGLGQSPAGWDKVLGCMKAPGPVACPELFPLAGGGPVTYEKLYQGLCALCEKTEGPLALCGLSLGAVLALAYALERPEKVSALVLIGGQCTMPRLLLRVQNGIFRLLPSGAFRGMGIAKKDVLTLTRSMLGLDYQGRLREISCPALVLCGERDRANKKAACTLGKGIPRARLEFIPGAGHEASADAPERLAEALESFFAENCGW